MKTQAEKIKQFLLKNTQKYPHDIILKAMQKFQVSRTTVFRHMQKLLVEGQVIKSGHTKNISYHLTTTLSPSFSLRIDDAFDEMTFFNENLSRFIKEHVGQNVYDILEYTITEMLNNVKDHSRAKHASVKLKINTNQISCEIQDEGIGLFNSLSSIVGSDDKRELIFQLSKGKVTRDPANHSGEGIFFTSRIVDTFEISANGYTFFRDNILHDWSFFKSNNKGTKIILTIALTSQKKLTNIFDEYTADNFEFSKTEVLINMCQAYGNRLISRSQAKRVVEALEKFTAVTLDFKNVEMIGQGFVDQIFRVYQNQRPDFIINYVNAIEDVEFMIKRGVAMAKHMKT